MYEIASANRLETPLSPSAWTYMTATHDVLNSAQRHAVEVPGGALLILAGPGSGKTRVIAHRITHLVEGGVPPWRIVAVTFTNKAAREMRERVESLLGDRAHDVTLGTFHSICARILRRDGMALGLPSDFAIYDTDDQMALVKGITAELHIDPKRYSPRSILSAISSAKNERRDAATVLREAGSYFEELDRPRLRALPGLAVAQSARRLRRPAGPRPRAVRGRALRSATVTRSATSTCSSTSSRTPTSCSTQLARELASMHRNITAVGDPDQSIYSWRAADIRNLQYFERDFPGAEVVLLEQNYRSTGHILRAAHAVIAKAAGRPQRELWTENPDGAPVVVQELYDGEEEALFIASEIRRLLREEHRDHADFAIMYRTNAQSRAIEEACIEHSIRYRVVGGTRFYDRREVRDLLAYLRLVHNHSDSVAFQRVANVPARGIGAKTLVRPRQGGGGAGAVAARDRARGRHEATATRRSRSCAATSGRRSRASWR